MFCQNCGKEINDNSKHCENCGISISNVKYLDKPNELGCIEKTNKEVNIDENSPKKAIGCFAGCFCFIILCIFLGIVVKAYNSYIDHAVTKDGFPKKYENKYVYTVNIDKNHKLSKFKEYLKTLEIDLIRFYKNNDGLQWGSLVYYGENKKNKHLSKIVQEYQKYMEEHHIKDVFELHDCRDYLDYEFYGAKLVWWGDDVTNLSIDNLMKECPCIWNHFITANFVKTKDKLGIRYKNVKNQPCACQEETMKKIRESVFSKYPQMENE